MKKKKRKKKRKETKLKRKESKIFFSKTKLERKWKEKQKLTQKNQTKVTSYMKNSMAWMGHHRNLTKLSSNPSYSYGAAAWLINKVSPPFFFFFFFFVGVTFVHANLCMHILSPTFQDGGNPFPVTRLPVLNSVTDWSWRAATTRVT